MFLPNSLKKEEIDSIKQINESLKQFEIYLKSISSEKNDLILFAGRNICEVMVNLLLKKEGYGDSAERTPFLQMCDILYRHSIIPVECYEFLKLIGIYRNKAVHGQYPSNKLLLSFLNAFNFLMQWFDNCFSLNYQIKFPIEKCCILISSLEYDPENNAIFIETEKMSYFKNNNILQLEELETKQEINKLQTEIVHKKEILAKTSFKENEFLTKPPNNFKYSHEQKNSISILKDEIKGLNEKLTIEEEKHEKQIEELNEKNDELLKKMDEYGKLFERCMEIIVETNDGMKRVEYKVDELHSKIDNISNNISTIQSFCERQIDNAQSTERIEEIISMFIDECIDNIMKHALSFKKNESYQIEKTKLIYSIGEEGWAKLCEKSKTFLITSKVMYNHLITMDDIIDYSGICVLVTKALEVELHKRFFIGFLEYLDGKYDYNYKKYHTALLYKNRRPLYSEKFNMGDVAFVMGYREDWNDTVEQKTNNKLVLMEYCSECIFSKYNEQEIEELLMKYASSIEEIRENYRNPSAHTNEIKRIDAEECFNLVLDIEKLLKKMLDSFDA